ncbi:condensation domain-containing protein [Methanobacterium sp.]|uniref:condensation domain-containing protein n=1 Tax=Methanobacterium sp. TaxID=2164 RepID=UPI003C761590
MSNAKVEKLNNELEHRYASNVSKYTRKVSNMERVFLWHSNCNVSMAARIKGNVSEERLSSALNMVRQMHPLIGAKIMFDGDYNAWFSTENVPQHKIKVVNRVSDTQWFGELQKEVQSPFDLEIGPLVKFILVHSQESSDLVVICNHSICDGMALVYLVRDLLNCYINPEKEIKTLFPPYSNEFLPDKGGFSLSSVFTRLIMYQVNRKWKKHPYYFTHEDYVALQTAYWEKNQYGAVLLELDSEEAKTLSKQCTKNGVTVGSAVTTAFIAAYEDVLGPLTKSQKQISVPFDLRRHATTPIGDVFCFCIGSTRFSYTYEPKKPFWKNVAVLHKEIHERVKKLDSSGLKAPNLHPTLMDAFSCFVPLKKVVPNAYEKTENLRQFSQDTKNIAFEVAGKSEHLNPGIIPSNLGRLNIPENYGDLQIDRMVFLPAISDIVPLILGGISIGGKMVFSMTYPEPKGRNMRIADEMIQIRNRALKYLGFLDKASESAIM